ncbi:3-hydroxyacyl-CoA dehydrogenase NAD-binding domain-containing protein [Bacteriovoracaceae bacterium]|nr:3-hydroxyacyl-CoA dehydrogenase NAD-binding domain-containing protein [Bacteriovoracaceae bacterium]
MSYQKISFEVKESVAYLGLGLNNDKSMTTLTPESLLELQDVIGVVEKLDQSGEATGLVIFSHKENCFLAGVDVTLISGLDSEATAIKGCEAGQGIYNRIEDLKMTTLALVDGICLGGGCELILSCDRVIVSDNTKTAIGLPEVMLGVLPGFGGTYRLPKKVGLPTALDMILSGKQIKAKKAVKLGLADWIMPSERMLSLASEYLTKKIDDKKKSLKDSLEGMAGDNFITRKIIFQKARETVLKKSKGFYPAPLKILELMENGHGKRRDAFLAREAQMFAELSQTPQSKSLQHIFFMTDSSKKLDKNIELKSVKRGAVLGAGTMGGGIAWLFAKNKQAPYMKDLNQAGLELGLKQASDNYQGALKRRRITKDDFNRQMTSITATTNYDGFKSVDLVVEAVVENMNVKKSVIAEVEHEVKADCLITSNTSSLSVNEMASSLENSKRFAGLHFFNPVNKMPLVEIIKHDNVSQKTIDSLYAWCLKVKKTPIVVGDGPGFLVNRILAPFLNESAYLLAEGISIEALDQAILNFGMPMGACRLMDEIGLDVCQKVGKVMEDGIGERMKACNLSAKITDAGHLGKKSGAGFYKYSSAGKSEGINEEILKDLPSDKLELDETTIQMRVFLPMINEASYILDEKIVDEAEQVDLGLIYGIGFPPFRGGLLKYADDEGLDRIVNAIERFSSSVSPTRYSLSPYLKKLAEGKKKFYE